MTVRQALVKRCVDRGFASSEGNSVVDAAAREEPNGHWESPADLQPPGFLDMLWLGVKAKALAYTDSIGGHMARKRFL